MVSPTREQQAAGRSWKQGSAVTCSCRILTRVGVTAPFTMQHKAPRPRVGMAFYHLLCESLFPQGDEATRDTALPLALICSRSW